MINSFHIKFFKCLNDFRIESLSRVNLLVGKNNEGKSTILEAVDLYASSFDLSHIIQMLSLRGEDMSVFKMNPEITSKDEIESLLPLVANRDIRLFSTEGISIGENSKELTAKLVRYEQYSTEKKVGYKISPLDDNSIDSNIALVLEDTDGNILNVLVSLNGGGFRSTFKNTDLLRHPVKLLSSRGSSSENEMLTEAWSEIAMGELEQYVIEALQIVDDRITRFNILGKESIPCVTIKGEQKPVRLNSMGDGLNKVLRIVLALLSCKDGILLIDEVENGLHYTVSEKLWNIIFKLSLKLNVQVIATTHSNDCLMSFIKCNDGSGSLIRMESSQYGKKAVSYERDEMDFILQKMEEFRNNVLDVR